MPSSQEMGLTPEAMQIKDALPETSTQTPEGLTTTILSQYDLENASVETTDGMLQINVTECDPEASQDNKLMEAGKQLAHLLAEHDASMHVLFVKDGRKIFIPQPEQTVDAA